MNLEHATEALKKYFGYKSFRPLQAEIIQTIYDGKDALVLMPTGGGKSICYQIPAITRAGTGLVVSPLISLMKDQVEALRANGIRASFLNSSLSAPEQRQVEDDVFNGNLELLYVSPEKLVSSSFIPLLKRSRINLFAIDEAHCISSWGHGFRPEYTQLKFLKEQFPDTPVIALTATADKVTRRDISKQLGLQEPRLFVASFDRPNLGLEVRPGQGRLQQILDFIKERPKQSGIIYCLSRKSTENLATKLSARGIRASYYHAGMDARRRSEVQEDFINDRVAVVCATVAFGMGIDKSNVRWVIHYNLPKNIESYYQEIGRAGRDGTQADTLLFYSYQDVMLYRQILSENESDMLPVKLEKLERMQQYAEAAICRRKMLLNYFGEDYQADDCGNCDVCKDPPEYIDGTVVAQKALSAVYRLKEQVGINMLIDVLRGSGRKEVMSKGYHQIKTYGAGRHTPAVVWKEYISQMINSGILEVAYDQKNALKLTPASHRVLFEKQPVHLVKFKSRKEREAEEKAAAVKPKRQRVRDRLFEELRKLRRSLAQQQGVPPYVIFNDASLEEMSATRPLTDEAFAAISGVGERKLQRYGDAFIQAIREFILQNSREGEKIKGGTYLETLDLFQEGKSIEAIAEQRELVPSTVVSHLLYWLDRGEPLDLEGVLPEETVQQVREAIPGDALPEKLAPIFEALEEKVPFHEIKLAVAILKERGEVSLNSLSDS